MQYRFTTRANYEDLAAGRVLHGAPGAPNFPVRLASELFQRALAERDGGAPVHIFDPCCGSAYLLTTLALLHGDRIARITASDVDADILRVAEANLGLLTPAGLGRRRDALRELYEAYGKPSHREALEAVARLAPRVARAVTHRTFAADATDVEQLRAGLGGERPDVVLSDFPYGRLKQWEADDDAPARILAALRELLAPRALLAIVVPRRTPLGHPGYERLQRVRVGKREAHLLRLA
jgi:hypothetical protein